MIERVRAWHPDRAAIGAALARAFPMPEDKDMREERRQFRRIEIGKALK